MKRMLWTLALTFLAAFGSGAWYSHHQASVARAARWTLHLEEDAADARLDKLVRLGGQQVTLGQLGDLVAAETGLEVTIDEDEIERVRGEYLGSTGPQKPARDMDCFLPVGQVTLRGALNWSLHSLYLDYRSVGTAIEITTQDAAWSDLRAVIYPLPQPMLAEMTEEAWADLIRRSVGERWSGGESGHIEPLPGALVIVQSSAVHRQVRLLLDGLERLELQPASLRQRTLLPASNGPPSAKLLAALDQPASLSCRQLPLRDVLARLAKEHAIAIEADDAELRGWGVDSSWPVTIDVANTSLRSLLRHILGEMRLTYLLRGDVLVVVTQLEAEHEQVVVAYPVADLSWADGKMDVGPLQELLTTHVAPQSWPFNGPAHIPELPSGWLVVTQSAAIHDEIAALLARLRTGMNTGGTPVVQMVDEILPATERIQALLRQPIALRYDRVPLRDVVRGLARDLRINIVIDERALQEAGVLFDPLMTWDVPAIPLQSQLYWMLRDLNLSCIVRDEALVITSTSEAELQSLTKIYDVRSLTDPDLGLADGQRLQSLIESGVAPGFWRGGRGSNWISEFGGLLAITTRARSHDEIEQLLAALETHSRRPATSSQSQPRVVRVDPSPSAERIERSLLEPISVNYCGVRVEELLRDLARRLELPLAFDQPALKEVEGYNFREFVSISAHERPLVEILDELFAPTQYDFDIRDDVLFFTFKARRNDEALQTRLYGVGDLLPARTSKEAAKLAGELTAIDTTYWNESRGGPGAILPAGTDWLAVSADWRRHQMVARWIASQHARPPSNVPTPSEP